jgi:hypothetical protein
MAEGNLMSEQFHTIITDSAIRSFNQGHNSGVIDERIRVMELIEQHSVSATTADGNYTVESFTITPSELVKLVRAN